MNTKNNQRFQDSEKKIQAALIDLLKSGDTKEITVHNICRSAEVNRTTFYAHFSDIRDLTEKCERQLRESLKAKFRETSSEEGNLPVPIEVFQMEFLQLVKEHIDFYRLYFLYHSIETAPNGPSQVWLFDSPAHLDRYRQAFYRAGIEAILRRWVEEGCTNPSETVQSILSQCLPENFL